MCSTYFFSTITVVGKTRINVTLYVHCLSCCWIQGVLKFESNVDDQNINASTNRMLCTSLCFQCCGCVRAEPIGAGGNAVHFIWRGDLEGAWLKSQVHTDYPDWSFPSFPQSLQPNSRMLRWIRPRLLPPIRPTPWRRVLLEKMIGPQEVKQFPAFYRIQRFITTLTTARHLSLSWARCIQSMAPCYFLKLNFNIIIPSTPRSSMWSHFLRFPHQNPICTSLLSICATCPTHLILVLLTWMVSSTDVSNWN